MAAGTTRPPMPSPGKPPMPGTGRGDPQQISQTMSKMTLAPVGPPQPQPPRGPPAPGNISLFRFIYIDGRKPIFEERNLKIGL